MVFMPAQKLSGILLAKAIFTLLRVNMALANQLPVIVMATTEHIQG